VLDEARAEHESIATELESLLAYNDDTGLLDGGVRDVAGVFADMADEEPAAPGSIGQYEVIREIGRGGMGVVYEAQQRFPQRRVAIKLVRSDVATPSMMRRFRHEAQALGMLQHAAIAQVLEAGAADVDGRLRSFLAMELAEGVSLHKWVREHKASAREILELMGKIADGVDHAHKRGVIHRDLKPENIIVTPDGRVKLMDFGVARLLRQEATTSGLLGNDAAAA
jgi:serine/threonine-protein kinase